MIYYFDYREFTCDGFPIFEWWIYKITNSNSSVPENSKNREYPLISNWSDNPKTMELLIEIDSLMREGKRK